MDPEESRLTPGEPGAAHLGVKLAGATTAEAHERLVAAGFRGRRIAIPGPRTKDGAAQWRAPVGLTPVIDRARGELLYTHPDGAVVRLYLEGGPTLGLDEVGPSGEPFARRSVLVDPLRPSHGFDDERFAVNEDVVPIPKTPRAADGTVFRPEDLAASYRTARASFAEQRIPLRRGAWPPGLPLVDGRGLGGGLTIVPSGAFWEASRALEALVPVLGGIRTREQDGDLVMFFAGTDELEDDLKDACPALASLTLHRGTCVLAVDPIGYEASTELLVELLVAVLPRLAPVVAYENATGADVTAVLGRRPRATLAAMDATRLSYSAP